MITCKHDKEKYTIENEKGELILVKCIFCGWRTWLLVKK